MNRLIYNIKLIWFKFYVCKKLQNKANNKYRVVQVSSSKFELQCYQDISITANTGPRYEWTPLLLDKNCISKDDYILMCKTLRNSEYEREVNYYINELNKYIKPIYPKVIY